jgi:enamine deaminase RidA (YjgF/YER057c/UK114 family)
VRPVHGAWTAQTHQVFERLRETMALVGGTLDDIVTMTVFITDPRFGPVEEAHRIGNT